MVVTQFGDVPDNDLTAYVGPTEIVHKHGKSYVFDSGTGVMIAELSESAADAIRTHHPVHMIYDGSTLTTEDT
jgi:hypothetical protein